MIEPFANEGTFHIEQEGIQRSFPLNWKLFWKQSMSILGRVYTAHFDPFVMFQEKEEKHKL